MAKDPFVLRHLFEFFVPSQCRCKETLPEALTQEVLKEVKSRMSEWFGGYTVSDARGGWVLESGELAEEPVYIIFSNATDEALKKHKNDFVAFAESIATRLSQEAIGYRIDGKMSFADGDSSVPCMHRQARFEKMDRRKREVLLGYQALEGALRRVCDGGIQSRRDAFFSLVTHTLGYDFVNKPVATPKWNKELRQLLFKQEPPTVVAGTDSGFKIILITLEDNRLLLTEQRRIIERLLKDDSTLRALFVVTNDDQSRWHFVNVPENTTDKRRLLRRFRIESKDQPMRTIVEQFSLIDVQKIGEKASIIDIKEVHDAAFDVEAITKEFYKNYKALFDILQEDLGRQTRDRAWAHDYVLQFLNRLMFIYFIQRKRWLGDNLDFLKHFWEAYRKGQQPEDSFVKRWLTVLFFEAFNEKFHGGYDYFPKGIRDALQMAPYLNGGLFSRNDLDDRYAGKFKITDERFGQTIAFLERYNFTVNEDTPLDQEVAVDAEMLGKVYESLVNVSEEEKSEAVAPKKKADKKKEAGIFYTPRTEIDMMCRLAVVDYLTNHLGEEHKSLLYETVFAYTLEDKTAADQKLTDHNLWDELDTLLQNITVVDPACGSGSFLIGMLQVLDDLIQRADTILGRKETPYERRKRIIGQSLYGVDVMRWAVDVAELRLWLQLVVETELKPAELKSNPLLPNLTFKIRHGDSLVQELGGINLAHIKGQTIPPALKGRLTRLKGEKLKFYNNDFESKFKSLGEIEREERGLFLDILKERKHTLENRLKETRRALVADTDLLGTTVNRIDGKLRSEVEAEQTILEADLSQTKTALEAFAQAKEAPFVWDIAFVEIFTGEKAGFDIVIGNPPYVRQEQIADPMLGTEKSSANTKKIYKEKLIRSIYRLWPFFFGVNPEKPEYKLNEKSDLYIYFYFHGLSLLNSKGSFCFITSNSWLDVGYGKDLQQFLLEHGHVKMVIDNQAKRSFSSADVNTVITLLAAPGKKMAAMHTKMVRFVMFKVPFEQAITQDVFKTIGAVEDRYSTPEYRVFPMDQKTLYEQGCDVPDDEDDDAPAKGRSRGPLIKVAHYIGNKWGGKYLRAPDIYWTILEKGKGKLVRLGDIAEVRFGIKTGANEFFYLTNEKVQEWGIEAEFLKPVIKSPRECKRILVDPKDLKFKLFMCHKDKRELKGTAALEYIKDGEKKGYHERPSCAGRSRWWDLGLREKAQINANYLVNDVMRFISVEKGFYVSDNFQEVHIKKNIFWQTALSCNSTILQLFANIVGRANFGGGLMKVQTYEVESLLIVNPELLQWEICKKIMQEIERADLKGNDRKIMDCIAFDAINLNKRERDEIYETVNCLVETRLEKADSLNT